MEQKAKVTSSKEDVALMEIPNRGPNDDGTKPKTKKMRCTAIAEKASDEAKDEEEEDDKEESVHRRFIQAIQNGKNAILDHCCSGMTTMLCEATLKFLNVSFPFHPLKRGTMCALVIVPSRQHVFNFLKIIRSSSSQSLKILALGDGSFVDDEDLDEMLINDLKLNIPLVGAAWDNRRKICTVDDETETNLKRALEGLSSKHDKAHGFHVVITSIRDSMTVISRFKFGNPERKLVVFDDICFREDMSNLRFLREFICTMDGDFQVACAFSPTTPLFNRPGFPNLDQDLQICSSFDQIKWCGKRGSLSSSQQPLTPNYLVKIGDITFPEPSDININMMPFIIGDESSIPEEFRHYNDIISACPVSADEIGKVGYLTIHEGIVNEHESQRRPGVHTERHPTPDNLSIHRSYKYSMWGRGRWIPSVQYKVDKTSSSLGPTSSSNGYPEGGIFMSSTISDTCRAWNTQALWPDMLGDCTRYNLDPKDGVMMKKNELYWMTDATPHESVPVSESCYRQYFRLVTSQVGAWYSKHSTLNPLGIRPGVGVAIIDIDKFQSIASVMSIDTVGQRISLEEKIQQENELRYRRSRSRSSWITLCHSLKSTVSMEDGGVDEKDSDICSVVLNMKCAKTVASFL